MSVNRSMGTIFVEGYNPRATERKGPPRLYHKKSRTGCQRCRARRVKCNEAKPVCRNCDRHQLPCIYDRIPQESGRSGRPAGGPGLVPELGALVGAGVSHTGSSGSPSSQNSSSHPVQEVGDTSVGDDPEESRSRRMLELELMHHYITEAGPAIALDKTSFDLWVKHMPRLSFQSDALLYSVYAVSALHQARFEARRETRRLVTHRRYLDMALREHANELRHLSMATLDILCLTSCLIQIYAFVMLQERPLEPYAPPLEWLRITGSTSRIFAEAWAMLGGEGVGADEGSSLVMRIIKDTPVVWNREERNGEDKRQDLLHLLRREAADELSEPWDATIQAAYETTLSYIGGVWLAMKSGSSPGPISRQLVVFPMLIDQRFINLVEEWRPRALVVLAHYFALVSMLRCYWFVQDAGPREVQAIARCLPPEWMVLMEWPIQIIEQEIVFM